MNFLKSWRRHSQECTCNRSKRLDSLDRRCELSRRPRDCEHLVHLVDLEPLKLYGQVMAKRFLMELSCSTPGFTKAAGAAVSGSSFAF